MPSGHENPIISGRNGSLNGPKNGQSRGKCPKTEVICKFHKIRLLHLAKNLPKVAAYGGTHESDSGYVGKIRI